MEARTVSKSRITTDAEWLDNPHAGEMLMSEFMEPLSLDARSLAQAIKVPEDRVRAIIEGDSAVDAALDLRLARYFGMSEGFFLRLQNSYEIVEAKRALNGELDRIVPRAA